MRNEFANVGEKGRGLSGEGQLKNLLAEQVSCCLYINLDRSTERRAQFEKWAEDLSFHRVQGVDGRKLDENFVASRGQWALGNSDTQYSGAIGCAMSHLQAIEDAMARITPGDERPVLIMEDDARIPEINLPVLKSVLQSGQTGDHCLLGSWHAIDRGFFPLTTAHPHIVEPSGALSATAYLVSPRMLPVLRDIYRFNLERPDMRQVDMVNETMHRNLALGLTPPRGSYDEDLMRVFRESCERNHVDAPKFRAVNPSVVFLTDVVSTIRPDIDGRNVESATTPPATAQQRADIPLGTGRPLKVLSKDDVIKLTDLLDKTMPGLAPSAQAQVKTTLCAFADDPDSGMSVDSLIKSIQTTASRTPVRARPTPAGFTKA